MQVITTRETHSSSSSSLCSRNQLKSSSVSDQTWSTPGLDLPLLPWSLSASATEMMSHDRLRIGGVLGVKHWIVLETMSERNSGTWADKGIPLIESRRENSSCNYDNNNNKPDQIMSRSHVLQSHQWFFYSPLISNVRLKIGDGPASGVRSLSYC